jgi:opacity protein-like surface antigen
MKPLKCGLLLVLFFLIFPYKAMGRVILSIGLAPETKAKEVTVLGQEVQCNSTSYVWFSFGITHIIKSESMGIGWYISGALPSGPSNSTEPSENVYYYDYYLVNTGIIFSYGGFYLYGGIGKSFEQGEVTIEGTKYVTEDSRTNLNFEMGIILKLLNLGKNSDKKFGLNVGIDTAPQAWFLGFSLIF